MKWFARAAACLLAAAISGCATPPRAPGEAPWTSGRLSLRVQGMDGHSGQNLSAGFEVRGNGQSGELNLISPLGTRLAAARWSAQTVLLTTPEGEHRFASLDELSHQVLGEVLPLAALPDWLAGRPWPLSPHQVQPGGFEQLGWQVDLARHSEGWIEARRAAAPAIVLRARIDATDAAAP